MSDITDLVTETKKRREADLLGLSNLDDPSASAIDDTVMQNAASWAIAYFETRTGRDFNSTSNIHITVGVHLVMSYLFLNAGNTSRSETETKFADIVVENIKKHRKITYSHLDYSRDTDNDTFNIDFEDLFGGVGVD